MFRFFMPRASIAASSWRQSYTRLYVMISSSLAGSNSHFLSVRRGLRVLPPLGREGVNLEYSVMITTVTIS